MEVKESMGQPAGVISGSGSSANAMHLSNSEASATPVLVRPDATRAVAAPFITSDTPIARAIAVPIVTTGANSSHLSTPPPYMPDVATAIVPLSVVADTGSGFGFANTGAGLGFGGLDSMKKKRGRPRKYGPGGSLTLAVTPLSTLAPSPLSPSQKRGRGRPPGSGKNQQLAALGELMLGSAGAGFTPHAITVAAGEDIASRIMSFSQQGPRGICILSANGAISNVTLRQPSISGGTVTYQGRFEILSLSGSFLLTESGGARSRTGGLSVSLAGPDGRVIGGGVAGVLIAASPVQVVVGSFMYNSKKLQPKPAKVQGPTGLSKLSTPNAGNPAAESSMNEMSDTKPGVPESPTLNQGTGATVSSNTDSPQGQVIPAQSLGWSASQMGLKGRRITNNNISIPG